MIKKYVLYLLIFGLTFFQASRCMADWTDALSFETIRPYVGADYQRRHMGFQNDFGGNLFVRNVPQYDVYGGIKLFKYLGISLGYETTENAHRTAKLYEGDAFLGVILPPGGGTETHFSVTKVKGTFVDLVGFYPICPRYNVEIFASIGLVRDTLYVQDLQIANDDILLDEPIEVTLFAKKTLPRATFGIQRTFIDHLGIRAQVAWERTSRFENLKDITAPNALTFGNAKDSVIIGIGAFFIV